MSRLNPENFGSNFQLVSAMIFKKITSVFSGPGWNYEIRDVKKKNDEISPTLISLVVEDCLRYFSTSSENKIGLDNNVQRGVDAKSRVYCGENFRESTAINAVRSILSADFSRPVSAAIEIYGCLETMISVGPIFVWNGQYFRKVDLDGALIEISAWLPNYIDRKYASMEKPRTDEQGLIELVYRYFGKIIAEWFNLVYSTTGMV